VTGAGHNIAVIADLAEAAAGPRAAAAPRSRRTADATAAAHAAFPDWKFAPNIGGHPDVYELENQAVDSAGHVLAAMHALARWDGRILVDLGCGAGFWLSRYAGAARTGTGAARTGTGSVSTDATAVPARAATVSAGLPAAGRVIGIEPDPVLRAAAIARTAHLPGTEVLAGSAERLPLPARSVDVVHARFAYFLAPGGEAGLAEVLRVLRPGGSLVVVDNDYRWGQFAQLLAAGSARPPEHTAAAIDTWWRERGAVRREVRSELRFSSRTALAAVLHIELPAHVARSWLARNPAATSLTYGYVLFAVQPADPGPTSPGPVGPGLASGDPVGGSAPPGRSAGGLAMPEPQFR
jgi:SAM-dependent methyltransferase